MNNIFLGWKRMWDNKEIPVHCRNRIANTTQTALLRMAHSYGFVKVKIRCIYICLANANAALKPRTHCLCWINTGRRLNRLFSIFQSEMLEKWTVLIWRCVASSMLLYFQDEPIYAFFLQNSLVSSQSYSKYMWQYEFTNESRQTFMVESNVWLKVSLSQVPR